MLAVLSVRMVGSKFEIVVTDAGRVVVWRALQPITRRAALAGGVNVAARSGSGARLSTRAGTGCVWVLGAYAFLAGAFLVRILGCHCLDLVYYSLVGRLGFGRTLMFPAPCAPAPRGARIGRLLATKYFK